MDLGGTARDLPDRRLRRLGLGEAGKCTGEVPARGLLVAESERDGLIQRLPLEKALEDSRPARAIQGLGDPGVLGANPPLESVELGRFPTQDGEVDVAEESAGRVAGRGEVAGE